MSQPPRYKDDPPPIKPNWGCITAIFVLLLLWGALLYSCKPL